jgi:hypothetical protein
MPELSEFEHVFATSALAIGREFYICKNDHQLVIHGDSWLLS